MKLAASRRLAMQTGNHPGGNPGANRESISDRCYLREVAFEWELTKETIYSPLDYLQGGMHQTASLYKQAAAPLHDARCHLTQSID